MKVIPLNRGKFVLVDDEDFERLSEYKWYCRKDYNTFYASRTIYPDGQKSKTTLQMHREVLRLTPMDKVSVDHRNRNGLDNQKNNLRIAAGSINQINTKKRKDNTSGFRGVNWSKPHNKWVARISISGRRISCGTYTDIVNAAKAYDDFALKYRKENAILNFPNIGGQNNEKR
jgi:hypothetical protein